MLVCLLACACSPLFAVTTTATLHKPARHHRFHRLHWTRWNPVFRPSHESLLIQNAEVDRLELPRIQDDDELEALKVSGALQPIIEGETLSFDPSLILHADIAVPGRATLCRIFRKPTTTAFTSRFR